MYHNPITLVQIQCAGEAQYTEDMPSLPNEVFAAFVLTTVALGTITKIDPTAALVSNKNIRTQNCLMYYILHTIFFFVNRHVPVL